MSNLDPVQTVLDRLEGAKKTGAAQWQARCPAHDDRHASLSVSRGEDGRALLHCHAGCARADVLRAVGLADADLFPPKASALAPRNGKPRGEIVATYGYRNAAGRLLFQVVRFAPKDFRQRRPDGNGGWTWKLDGVPRLLFRLPELLAADATEWVFIPEGEKDCGNVAAFGLVATTNPGGAGKWGRLADDSALHGRRVAIIADKDAAGRAHALDVAARLHNKAAVVKIIELPAGEVDGRPIKDVSDWMDGLDCRTPEELAAALRSMAEDAPVWTPEANAKANGSGLSGPVLVNMADVVAKLVRWLWPSRFAIGKLTLIAGDPGLGKSFLTLDMAARVSKGDGWPDSPASTAAPGGVVLLSAEDDLEDTIKPRLIAAKADVSRIKALVAVKHFDLEAGGERQCPFNLDNDLAVLEQAIQDVPDCRLVIIDPISAYLGRTDSHKNAAIRGLLAPLSELAARHGVALVAVTHLRKGEGPAMYRTMGSLGFVAAARAVYAVTKDKGDRTGGRRFLLPVKNNVGNDRDGLAYSLDDTFSTNGQPVVKWEAEPVSISADEALCPDNGRAETETPELNEAKAWLQNALADGPLAAKDIFAQARQDGIAKRTLDRAKKALGVVAAKEGFSGGWIWRLPGMPTDAPHGEDGQAQERQGPGQEDVATFGDVGNLREKPKEHGDSDDTTAGGLPEDCQARRSGNLHLAPDQPGPVDLLDPEQHKRYLAIYHSRSASMSASEKHARAWRAALAGGGCQP